MFYNIKKQIVVKLPDSISKLQSIIHQLYQEINELETKNTSLEEENKELQAQLKQNSQNSSKPPSPDRYKKKPAFPGKKGGIKAGRKGHEDNTLLQVKNPYIIEEHEVERCTCDNKDLSNSPFSVVETRQVFDLPKPRLMIPSHQIHQTRCPERGRVHKADAPRGVNAPVQYGNGVKALVMLLNTGYKLPFKKIQTLFTGLFVHSKHGKKALSRLHVKINSIFSKNRVILLTGTTILLLLTNKLNSYEKIINTKQQTLRIDKKEIPFRVKFYKICNDLKNQSKTDIEFMNKKSPAPNNA